MIHQYQIADRLHGNSPINYEKQFRLKPESPNKSRENDSWNEFFKLCKKRTGILLKKNKGHVFTRKIRRHQNATQACANDEGLYKLFKIIHELSKKSMSMIKPNKHSINRDGSKMKNIGRMIRRVGKENIYDHILSQPGIIESLDTMDYDKLKSHVKMILLSDTFIKHKFDNSRKVHFSQRREIREIPHRNNQS
jgi:hypothetical protein